MNSPVFHQSYRNFYPIQCFDPKLIRNLHSRGLVRVFHESLWRWSTFAGIFLQKLQSKTNNSYFKIITINDNNWYYDWWHCIKAYQIFGNFMISDCCLVANSCVTLCDPMDHSLPGSSVHGISQPGILEWVAFSFSRGFSQLRDRTCVSCIAGGFLLLNHQESLCFLEYLY